MLHQTLGALEKRAGELKAARALCLENGDRAGAEYAEQLREQLWGLHEEMIGDGHRQGVL